MNETTTVETAPPEGVTPTETEPAATEPTVQPTETEEKVAAVETAPPEGVNPPAGSEPPTGEDEDEPAERTLAGALVALHPVKKQRLYSEIDGIVRQGGMKTDTVLHLIGTAIQRELDA